jgi:AraC-like DNA-binding protein
MKKEEGFGSDLRLNIAFVELMLCVSDLVGNAYSPAPAALEEFEKIRPVLSYIREHLCETLTLDEIARQAFISKHYLCHLFKKVTGFSVGEYISSSRILLAEEYLRSGMSVQRAGELSGFPNNSHFIRTFHAMVGLSPGKYARKHRQTLSS